MAEQLELTGTCAYCGKTRIASMTQDEWEDTKDLAEKFAMPPEDYEATTRCTCRQGTQFRDRMTILQRTAENIENMFRSEHEDIADLLQEAARPVYDKCFKRITITDYKGGKATMSLQKGLIKLEYEQKKKTELTSE